MRTKLVVIGNSKGVRIPKPLLEEAGIKKEIDLSLKDGKLVISPIKTGGKLSLNEEYLLSYKALAREWDTPEEDAAWADL